jgi:hypothetical protein
MPTIYAIINKHSDERMARAAARRDRIAAGNTGRRKKALTEGAAVSAVLELSGPDAGEGEK